MGKLKSIASFNDNFFLSYHNKSQDISVQAPGLRIAGYQYHHGLGAVGIGLLQLAITWYKIGHAGGQAHYYSRTGTSKQRQVKLHWFRSLCFNVPLRE